MTMVLPAAPQRRKLNFTAYELTVFGVVVALFLLAAIGPFSRRRTSTPPTCWRH